MLKNELIRLLTAIPGNPRVVLQKDPEGNGFAQLDGCGLSTFEDPASYRPELMDDDGDERLADLRAIVLWPA